LFIKRKKGEEKFEKIIKEKIAIRRHADYRMVYIVPASPIKSVIHFNKDMDTFIKSIEPNTLRFGNYQPIRDGGYYEYKSEFSVEITKEGLICYRENWRQRDSTSEVKGDIMIDTSMIMLFQILRYAKKIYEKIGFYGNVIIGAEIYGTENKVLFTTPNRMLSEEYSTTAKSVLVNQRFSYSEFENIYHATYTIIEILLRSFKLVLDEKVLSEWISTLMTTVKE